MLKKILSITIAFSPLIAKEPKKEPKRLTDAQETIGLIIGVCGLFAIASIANWASKKDNRDKKKEVKLTSHELEGESEDLEESFQMLKSNDVNLQIPVVSPMILPVVSPEELQKMEDDENSQKEKQLGYLRPVTDVELNSVFDSYLENSTNESKSSVELLELSPETPKKLQQNKSDEKHPNINNFLNENTLPKLREDIDDEGTTLRKKASEEEDTRGQKQLEYEERMRNIEENRKWRRTYRAKLNKDSERVHEIVKETLKSMKDDEEEDKREMERRKKWKEDNKKRWDEIKKENKTLEEQMKENAKWREEKMNEIKRQKEKNRKKKEKKAPIHLDKSRTSVTNLNLDNTNNTNSPIRPRKKSNKKKKNKSSSPSPILLNKSRTSVTRLNLNLNDKTNNTNSPVGAKVDDIERNREREIERLKSIEREEEKKRIISIYPKIKKKKQFIDLEHKYKKLGGDVEELKRARIEFQEQEILEKQKYQTQLNKSRTNASWLKNTNNNTNNTNSPIGAKVDDKRGNKRNNFNIVNIGWKRNLDRVKMYNEKVKREGEEKMKIEREEAIKINMRQERVGIESLYIQSDDERKLKNLEKVYERNRGNVIDLRRKRKEYQERVKRKNKNDINNNNTNNTNSPINEEYEKKMKIARKNIKKQYQRIIDDNDSRLLVLEEDYRLLGHGSVEELRRARIEYLEKHSLR